MIRLPVSGHEIEWIAPSGEQDILLLEWTGSNLDLAARLLSVVARPMSGNIDWRDTPFTDVEVALLQLRRAVFGDLVRTDSRCRSDQCGSRIDVGFSIDAYLGYHHPRIPESVRPSAQLGWFEMPAPGSGTVSFRPPTIADIAALPQAGQSRQQLAARCIEGPVTAKLQPRIEKALEAIAPPLSGDLDAVCAECGQPIPLYFDPVRYVLAELRYQAGRTYTDVHLLASAYHWPEATILQMPSRRRSLYVELVLQSRRSQ